MELHFLAWHWLWRRIHWPLPNLTQVLFYIYTMFTASSLAVTSHYCTLTRTRTHVHDVLSPSLSPVIYPGPIRSSSLLRVVYGDHVSATTFSLILYHQGTYFAKRTVNGPDVTAWLESEGGWLLFPPLSWVMFYTPGSSVIALQLSYIQLMTLSEELLH